MTIQSWLQKTTKMFESAGIATARLDALVLLEDATGKDRAWLLAHPQDPIVFAGGRTSRKLNEMVGRRAGHEPLAYIRGKSEFYGREFKVTPATLQPRPETETMIDLLKDILREVGPPANDRMVVADIGTGSGCLAVTAKLEWPMLDVYASEINDDALKVAKANAKNLKADITFFKGNLLEPLSTFDFQLSTRKLVILANLPYVPDNHTINEAAMQEPKVAIFGGADGLDLYRKMFTQIQKLKTKPKFILTESLPFQHKTLSKIASKSDYKSDRTEDFIQVFIT